MREDSPGSLVEEADAPVDRLAQRLLACGKIARSAGEDAQPVIEAFAQRAGRQRANARRSELHRERKAVDTRADLTDVLFARGRALEARVEELRTLHEKLNRIALRERRHRKHALTRNVQDRSARDDQGHPRRPGNDLRKRWCCVAHVLGVVDDEQKLPQRERVHELHERLFFRIDRHVECPGNGRDHEVRIAQRSELHDGGPVRERARGLPRRFEREPCLAASACSGEDDQSGLAAIEQRLQLGELTRASDKRVRGNGKRFHRRWLSDQLECGVLLKNPPLQISKGRTWLDPQLVVEPGTQYGVVIERIGLTAAPIEGEHHQLVDALPVWILCSQSECLSHSLRLLSESEPRGNPLLESDEPELLEPRTLLARPRPRMRPRRRRVRARERAPDRRAIRRARGSRREPPHDPQRAAARTWLRRACLERAAGSTCLGR